MRMFGCSRGLLGRFGGIIMARTNEECGNWVVSLLEVQSADSVLEIGFGPGVAIKRLSMLADRVAGVDPSPEMIAQAQARNAPAVATGRVELRRGTPPGCRSRATPSTKRWLSIPCKFGQTPSPDCATCDESPGGWVALGFTPYSGQKNEGVTEKRQRRFRQAACGREGEEFLRARSKTVTEKHRAFDNKIRASSSLSPCRSKRVARCGG